ncbi:LacI family DNA-binding transcriptional regulator [Aneurinibacillus sp. Ricciae_BoGa-3]|uniref:LacI family DNA-binding transcriptional regulator n=1 Tax=Aneurinibacillus sp. Ricciae_BoGa-3 TaxID=3022697 RepID=UPI0023424F7B|nr:LacI family DNA-binding transcriptional regulator [Aneurinibacillus sp. Ricciae_BoGa-3]WCK56395.1 LacI family DNA-binding transcriptional regulator [Aneurinibacillus sp. Ricciae_BoGa-3]
MERNVTAFDVAKHLGVSQSTVSRVFTAGASVSETTRKRVLAAAKELGYRPNALARSLSTKRTNIIGLVMGDTKNPFYPAVLSKFSGELRKRGFHVLLVNAQSDTIQSEEVLQFLEYNVAGVVVTDALLSSSIAAHFMDNHIPIVLFNRHNQIPMCHTVCCDNMHGGFEIGEYLIAKGHRRLAFIAGSPNTSTSLERETGFREALVKHGYHLITDCGHYSYEGGSEAAVRLLKSVDPPDAIFCANDIMALGVIDAAKQMGLRVPYDVSVVGFDDIDLAAWSAYSLTTWQQPVNEMIAYTIDLLLGDSNGNSNQCETECKWIKGLLVERGSVRQKH